MKKIALNILGFLAYILPKWCCKPALVYSDWYRKRTHQFKYVWLADQNNKLWRLWREMVLKGADKLIGKEAALKWRGPWQNIKVYDSAGQFYRKEKK